MRKKFFIASIAISAITLFLACTKKDFNTLISEGDFAGAYDILLAEIKNSRHDLYGNDFVYLEDIKEITKEVSNIYSMADILYKDWILDILYSDTDNPEKAILQLLAEYPILGVKGETGLQDYFYDKYPFVSGTSHYNQLCDKIFTAALMAKKYDIAETIVNAYMEDVEVIKPNYYGEVVEGVEMDGNHSYVKYSTKSQTEARKKLDEALENS